MRDKLMCHKTFIKLKEITNYNGTLRQGSTFYYNYYMGEVSVGSLKELYDANNWLDFYYRYLAVFFHFPEMKLRKIHGAILCTLHEIGHAKTVNEDNWDSLKSMSNQFRDMWETALEDEWEQRHWNDAYNYAYRRQPMEYLADAFLMDIIEDYYNVLVELSEKEEWFDTVIMIKT